jgi:hypothetical protein
MGARSKGLGNLTSTLPDEWSVLNNMGALAGVKQTIASASYEIHPQLSSANRSAFVLAMPLQIGVAGFSAFRFGDDLYSEQIISLGYSNRFGLASLGAKINYIQYRAEGFGSKGVLSVSFGGLAQLTPVLSVGAHIVNMNQPKISESTAERIPTVLVAGIGIRASEKVFTSVEIEKDIEYDPTLKMGIEYQPFPKFSVRTGFNMQPQAAFFGFGFSPKKLVIDYSLQYNPVLGTSHQASVGYKFRQP